VSLHFQTHQWEIEYELCYLAFYFVYELVELEVLKL
jgi:hypothetical protein